MGLGSPHRVFKKTSPDGSMTMYVDRRVFVDHLTSTEPIEGVVVVDKSAVGEKKVFAAVVATFRFGREEDEILGMTFCRELYLTHDQVWPPLPPKQTTEKEPESSSSASSAVQQQQQPSEQTTEELLHAGSSHGEEGGSPATSLLNEKVVMRSGEESVNYTFKLPEGTPPSAVMQHGPKECGDSCGVRYFLRCYLGTDESDKPQQANTVDLAVRKVQFAPCCPTPCSPPSAKVTKDFPLSPGKMFLEANLDKKMYAHGEELGVNVMVQNQSGKTVKHVKVSVVQVADICMFSTGRWKVNVAATDNHACTAVHAGATYQHRFSFCPNLDENRAKYGIFTQAKVTSEEDCLASSTIVPDKEKAEFFGIIISYYVKVKLCLSSLNPLPSLHSEVSCILPFMLVHPETSSNVHPDVEIPCPLDWTPLGSDTSTDHKASKSDDAVFQKMSRLHIHMPVTS